MTMTEYSNGYGRRDPVPECIEVPDEMECPCCEGAGEHPYGAGMDADAVECFYCEGAGVLAVVREDDQRLLRVIGVDGPVSENPSAAAAD